MLNYRRVFHICWSILIWVWTKPQSQDGHDNSENDQKPLEFGVPDNLETTFWLFPAHYPGNSNCMLSTSFNHRCSLLKSKNPSWTPQGFDAHPALPNAAIVRRRSWAEIKKSCCKKSCWYVRSKIPSGKHSYSYWKWTFIVDLPIKNGDFP